MSDWFDEILSNASTLLTIPGTVQVEGREFWYIQAESNINFLSQFRVLLEINTESVATKGGISLENCLITTPNNTSFMALSYKGDLPGWRSRIKEAAGCLGLMLAQLKSSSLVIDNQEQFLIAECEVKFFSNSKSVKSKPEFRKDFEVIKGKVIKV